MNLTALDRGVSRSFSHSVSQSVNQPVSQSVSQPVCHVADNGNVTRRRSQSNSNVDCAVDQTENCAQIDN